MKKDKITKKILNKPTPIFSGNKTTQYKVVERYSAVRLASAIEEYLSNGWELQGGVSFSASNYAQAIIRKQLI